MRVDRFEVRGLHGLIDAEINFYPDITVVVGRNGSGKTSSLDLMSSMIQLDLYAIANTKFTHATLSLSDKSGSNITLSAEQSERSTKVSFSEADERSASLEIPANLEPNHPLYSEYYDRWVSRFSASSKTNVWQKKASYLKKNAKLTFVRIDRTILAIDSDGVEAIEASSVSRNPRVRNTSFKDPIDNVIRVTRSRYGVYRRTVAQIQRTASDEMIRLLFSSESLKKPSRTGRGEATDRIHESLEALKRRVNESALMSTRAELLATSNDFFSNVDKTLREAAENKPQGKKVGRRTLKEENLEVIIGVIEGQISGLLKIFEKEQEQSSRAYRDISNYLNVANGFLRNSGKTLKFSPSELDLCFDIIGRERNEIDAPRSVRELSSGERQVLIVLTYLAFISGSESIFVVDEPELSLHVTWQKRLVGALKSLRPEGCQIILATHSPEIAGQAIGRCRILKPSYLPSAEPLDDVESEGMKSGENE